MHIIHKHTTLSTINCPISQLSQRFKGKTLREKYITCFDPIFVEPLNHKYKDHKDDEKINILFKAIELLNYADCINCQNNKKIYDFVLEAIKMLVELKEYRLLDFIFRISRNRDIRTTIANEYAKRFEEFTPKFTHKDLDILSILTIVAISADNEQIALLAVRKIGDIEKKCSNLVEIQRKSKYLSVMQKAGKIIDSYSCYLR
ncbi:MAG: hypothetical protein AB1391_00270 [Candidatus Micrarchaeota archaeon]